MTEALDTLRFDRRFSRAPTEVFAAFAETDARATWGPPTPDLGMHFTEADFRVGGRDLCVCGPGPAEGVEVLTLYHAITEPSLIVFTEILRVGGTPTSAALVTVDIAADGDGTALNLAVQISGFGDPDAIPEMTAGWTASLENLSAYLAA